MRIFGVSVAENYIVATQSLAYEETYHVLVCALDEYIIDDDLD